MADRDNCVSTTRDGLPCSAKARPGSAYCAWHDPALAEQRDGWRRSGGSARSNANRAAKRLPADLRGILDGLFEAFDQARNDTLPRGRARELSVLAGAICKTYEIAEMDGEVQELRDAIAELKGRAS